MEIYCKVLTAVDTKLPSLAYRHMFEALLSRFNDIHSSVDLNCFIEYTFYACFQIRTKITLVFQQIYLLHEPFREELLQAIEQRVYDSDASVRETALDIICHAAVTLVRSNIFINICIKCLYDISLKMKMNYMILVGPCCSSSNATTVNCYRFSYHG